MCWPRVARSPEPSTIEMETVTFDEQIGEDDFAPLTARDTNPHGFPGAVRLTDLPEAMPFTVLVPEQPPFGTQ
jgi:hypothetical protein